MHFLWRVVIEMAGSGNHHVMKKLIPIIIVLGVGIALGIYIQKQPKTRKLETEAQTGVEQAGADVKAGAQKTEAAVADVKTDIAVGIQKTESIATNIAAQAVAGAKKVGEVTTNVVGEVKGKLP